MTAWHAIHLFVADRDDLDILALEAATLMASFPACRHDWFFIRYLEGGLHLRLRIGAEAGRHFAAIRSHMAATCARLGAGRSPEPWALRLRHPDAAGDYHAVGAAIDVPYVPEVRRYAGPAGLPINEQLFRDSTRAALAVIRASRGDARRRAGLAMELMLAGVIGLCGADVAPQDFMRSYAAFWAETWREAGLATNVRGAAGTSFAASCTRYRDVAAGQRAIASPIDDWCATLAAARAGFAELHASGQLQSPATGAATQDAQGLAGTLASLAHSQIHMLNNRLGLWPHDEIAMAEFLAEHLR
jgi:hypothetical protein